jgi:hypothetical protein
MKLPLILLSTLMNFSFLLVAQPTEGEFNSCQEYSSQELRQISDSVSKLIIYVPEYWKGEFEGDIPKLNLDTYHYGDTTYLRLYQAWDTEDNYFQRIIEDKNFKRKIEYQDVTLFLTNRLLDSNFIEHGYHFKLDNSGWVYKLLTYSKSQETLVSLSCDVKHIIKEYIKTNNN